MKMKPRHRLSWMRLLFALSIVALCALLLFDPLYSVLYPVHHAKSKAKPPKWKRSKARLYNSCDLQAEHPPTVDLQHVSRLYVYTQNQQTKLILSTILLNDGNCDAVESKAVVFIESANDLPAKVQLGELLVVLYEHPIDLHVAAVASKKGRSAGKDCSCGQFLAKADPEGFQACYAKMLTKKHCERVFQLSSEERSIVEQWQSLVTKRTGSMPAAEQPDEMLILEGSRLAVSTRVLMALLPQFFADANKVYRVAQKRERAPPLSFSRVTAMLEKDLFDNKAIVQFYDDFMAERFWKAVEAAGFSPERNRYCY